MTLTCKLPTLNKELIKNNTTVNHGGTFYNKVYHMTTLTNL